jgi:hypothetical protein
VTTFANCARPSEYRVKLYLTGDLFDRVDEFYAGPLGLLERHRWSNAANRGVMFELGPYAILELIDRWTDTGPVGAFGLSVAVADVWDLQRQLSANGCSVGALRDNDWGDTSCTIRDPAGFSITFFTQTNTRERRS